MILILFQDRIYITNSFIKSPNYYYMLHNFRYFKGTFGCHEPFCAVRNFVEEHLIRIEPMLFVLKDPISGKEINDDTKTLSELNLLPAAVLHFEWDSDVQSELLRLGREVFWLGILFFKLLINSDSTL